MTIKAILTQTDRAKRNADSWERLHRLDWTQSLRGVTEI